MRESRFLAKESVLVHRRGPHKRAKRRLLCRGGLHRGLSPVAVWGGGRHILPMTIRKIARMGHPVLAEIAKPVADPTAPEIRVLVADMVETMIDANGAGLAAPQVHVPLRVVVFQAPAERAPEGINEEESFDHTAALTVLINPEIELLTDEMEDGWEGCLSVPGLRGLVPRHTELIYRGVGLDGEVIERRAKGFHARVVQHECDHLDGLLYPQRMTDLGELIFESEVRHRIKAEADAEEEAADA